jgi:hypothetical protein
MIDLDRAAAAAVAAGGQHERPLLVLVKLPVRTIIAANPGRTYYSTINHSFTCCLHQAAAGDRIVLRQCDALWTSG